MCLKLKEISHLKGFGHNRLPEFIAYTKSGTMCVIHELTST